MSVSRALRGLPGVSVETRAHVLNVASELGYHTNELARILRTGATSGLVGLVVTNLANPFYSQLATGVEDTIKEHGLQVILGNTNEDSDRERQLFADLMERRVDGIVVVPAATTDRSHYAAAARVVPLVFAARPPLGIAADSVLVDDVGGARQATEALLAAGHRRIGFIGNPPRVFTGGQRFKGYASALAAAGIDVSPSLVSRVSTTVAAATHATARMLNESSPPSALFTANNQLTLGALLAVRGRERPPSWPVSTTSSSPHFCDGRPYWCVMTPGKSVDAQAGCCWPGSEQA